MSRGVEEGGGEHGRKGCESKKAAAPNSSRTFHGAVGGPGCQQRMGGLAWCWWALALALARLIPSRPPLFLEGKKGRGGRKRVACGWVTAPGAWFGGVRGTSAMRRGRDGLDRWIRARFARLLGCGMDGPGRVLGGPCLVAGASVGNTATGDGEGQGAAGVVGTWGVRFGRAPRGRWHKGPRVRPVDHVTRALAHAAAAGLLDASALSGHLVHHPVGVFWWLVVVDDDAADDAIVEFQCKEAVRHV